MAESQVSEVKYLKYLNHEPYIQDVRLLNFTLAPNGSIGVLCVKFLRVPSALVWTFAM